MNTAKLEQTMKQKLAGVGLDVRPDSPADRGISKVARASARVVTSSRHAFRKAETVIREAAESARETIHEATRPPAGAAPRRRRRTGRRTTPTGA
jgi:hypothetical protein